MLHYPLTIMLRKARACSPHTMTHAHKTDQVGHYHVTHRSLVCGLRTSTLADRDPQIFRGTDDWNRLRTGPPRIKTTVTVQLRMRSMRGLVVAVHLRTSTDLIIPMLADAVKSADAHTVIPHTTRQAPRSLPVISY